MITKFFIEDKAGTSEHFEIPDDMGLSLMEVLRAASYPIAATCGGIALCATCLVEVISGGESLLAPGDAELEILDVLPLPAGVYRLSCQLRIDDALNGCVLKLPA